MDKRCTSEVNYKSEVLSPVLSLTLVDPEGARDPTHSRTLRPIFFKFHAVFEKILPKIIGWQPLTLAPSPVSEILDPPLTQIEI